MAEDSFILVNLKESKAKKLAQVIANETSRKILDFLSKKEATETEIAKELSLPISTVHYNLKHLEEANLVQVDEFHYSEKGKEVDHYKISNKFVIIAPETPKMDTIKKKLRRILPVALISLAGAGIIQLITKFQKPITQFAAPVAQKGAEMAAEDADVLSKIAVQEAAPQAAEALNETTQHITQVIVPEQNIALWFLLGALFALILYFVIDYFRKK